MSNLQIELLSQIKTMLPTRALLRVCLLTVFGLGPAVGFSDELVWVLGSYSDADSAEKVALDVHQLTGQRAFVQSAVVNGLEVYRALVGPGERAEDQARTTRLLSEASYDQTWAFSLDTERTEVTIVGRAAGDDVMQNDRAASAEDAVPPEPQEMPAAAQVKTPGPEPRVDPVVTLPSRSLARDPVASKSDYHPIRLKSGR